jgi:RNA polymerase sigma factor (sigma-70 family)
MNLVASALLSPTQQKYIRNILSNPATPYMIKVKTQNIVYEHYVGWAHGVAKNATTSLSPDLMQSVSTGLLAAIRKYDWSRKTNFTSYAKKYVLSEVYSHTRKCSQIRNNIHFVSPANQWIFDKVDLKNDRKNEIKKTQEIQKQDILCLLDPEERRLFEYVYGGIFSGEKGRSVRQVCDLMAYGNEETYRIRKTRLMKKIISKKLFPHEN